MADFNHGSLPSPKDKHRKSASFLSSPRLFTAFASKSFFQTEAVMSPTSILDSKTFSCLKNPLLSEINTIKRHRENLESRKVGLGIVAFLGDEKSGPKLSKPESRMVLFGSQLKIQIPVYSPAEFGIKTRNSHLGSFSPGFSQSPVSNSPFGSVNSGIENPNSSGSLSVSEMELSEDYTCIICHGPNPKTTHIFDNCIIESCCGIVGLSDLKKDNEVSSDLSSYPSENFLGFCYTCKKTLEVGKDIYIYRGDKAFCSDECRHQQMLLEEEDDNI